MALVDEYEPWVLYTAGALLFLLLLLVVVLAIRSGRRRRKATVPREPDATIAWGEPTGMEPAAAAPPADQPPQPSVEFEPPAEAPQSTHHCRCPACQTQFTVTGSKPIVTNCPGCGKKGYLR